MWPLSLPLAALFAPAHGRALVWRIVGGLAASILLLVLANTVLKTRGRRALIVLVTFLGGLFFTLEYFLPVSDRWLWPAHPGSLVLWLGVLVGAALAVAGMVFSTKLWDSLRGKASLALVPIGIAVAIVAYHFARRLPARIPNTEGAPANFLTPWIEPAVIVLMVVGSFTVGLGVHSLVQLHGRTLLRRRAGWFNSLAFFVAMIAMFAFALLDFYTETPPKMPAGVLPFSKAMNEVLFTGIYQPLISATFSLLAFYIASAAYRAFRIRSAEAALMMVAAFLVMLGQVPLGSWLTHGLPQSGPFAFLSFFRLERFGEWIMAWWNAPAQRGILFGVAVGALAMSLRVWLSLERGTFFSQQPEASGEPSSAESAGQP